MMPIMFMVYEFPYVICAAYGGYLAKYKNLSAGGLVSFVLLLRFLVGPASNLPNLVINSRSATSYILNAFVNKNMISAAETSNISFMLNGIILARVNISFSGSLRVLGDKVQNSLGTLNKHLGDIISGFKTTRMLNIGSIITGRYINENNSMASVNVRRTQRNSQLNSINYLMGILSMTGIYIIGALMVINRMVDISTVAAVVSLQKGVNFIINLPEGYHTNVGERGTKFSGGQKQCIAIARAFIKNAPILLLDESTSALNSQSEQLVQKGLDALIQGRTALIIAHRMSIIKNANAIYIIENGKVSEFGTHDELIDKGGLYKRLYNIQLTESLSAS